MAKIKLLKRPKTKEVQTPKKKYLKDKKDYSLPTEKTVPVNDLSKLMLCFYGDGGAGKTNFSMQFDNPIHFHTEPGGRSKALFKVPVDQECFTDWKDILGYAKQLKNDKRFKTVVIDTGTILYDLCFVYICENANVEHPNQAGDFGITWNNITREFTRFFGDITSYGKGILLLTHSKREQITEIDGRTVDYVNIAATPRCREFLIREMDIIGHYGYYGRERIMTIRQLPNVFAKTRADGHFLTPRGKDIYDEMEKLKNNETKKSKYAKELQNGMVYNILLGNHPSISYDRFQKAYNNQQEETLYELEPDKPKKKKIRFKK